MGYIYWSSELQRRLPILCNYQFEINHRCQILTSLHILKVKFLFCKIAIFVSSADLIHVVILSETRKYLFDFRGYRYFIDLTLHPLNWGLIMLYFLTKCIIYHFYCRHFNVNTEYSLNMKRMKILEAYPLYYFV